MKKWVVVMLMVILVGSMEAVQFPTIKGKTLSSKRVSVPQDYQGQHVVVILGFDEDHKEDVEGWMIPFEQDFKNPSEVDYIAIPMIGPSFFNFLKYQAVRKNVAKHRYPKVMVYPKKTEPILDVLGIQDTRPMYLFLLDPTGNVVWQETGSPTDQKRQSLYQLLGKSVDEPSIAQPVLDQSEVVVTVITENQNVTAGLQGELSSVNAGEVVDSEESSIPDDEDD